MKEDTTIPVTRQIGKLEVDEEVLYGVV